MQSPDPKQRGAGEGQQPTQDDAVTGTCFPVLRKAGDGTIIVPDEFWTQGLSLGVAGAVGSRHLAIEALDGSFVSSGLHLIIAANQVEPVFSVLVSLLDSIKVAQRTHSEPAKEIVNELRRKRIEALQKQYRLFLQREQLPDPEHDRYFAGALRQLAAEEVSNPITLLESPPPGRLVLGLEHQPNSVFLAAYDDRTFGSLLDAARTARGSLDLEVLVKSSRGQIFDGAQLEGICNQAIQTPRAWAIIVAFPETAARFLLSANPIVASFADCCWFIDATACPCSVQARRLNLPKWENLISRLLKNNSPGARQVVRLTKEDYEAILSFQQQLAKACVSTAKGDTRFLGHLPRLVTQVAALYHLAELPGFSSGGHAAAAITSFEVTAGQRMAKVQSWRASERRSEFERESEFLLAKIAALGPISARDLCRSCDELRMRCLVPVLKCLLDGGRILKLQDGRFDISQRLVNPPSSSEGLAQRS